MILQYVQESSNFSALNSFIWGIDWYYIVLVLPMIILSLIAQAKVKSTYSKYSKIANGSGLTGAQVAREILDNGGLQHVQVQMISGQLTDNFNPKTNIVSLSQEVYSGTSVAAMGIAAHECGHALQHAKGYVPVKLRSAMVPVVNFASSLSWIVIVVGLLMANTTIAMIGVIFMAAATVFYLVTLPVEFNASRRAKRLIVDLKLAKGDDSKGVKKVLSAAAMTYVTAFLTSLMSLLRMFLLVRRRD